MFTLSVRKHPFPPPPCIHMHHHLIHGLCNPRGHTTTPNLFFSVTQPIRTCHNHLDHVLGSHGPCTPTTTSFEGYAAHLHLLRRLGEEERKEEVAHSAKRKLKRKQEKELTNAGGVNETVTVRPSMEGGSKVVQRWQGRLRCLLRPCTIILQD
jgi:hypothetical protein